MRLAVVDARATLLTDAGPVDVERESEGRFPSDVTRLYEKWAAFREWARGYPSAPSTAPLPASAFLGPVSPRPAQILAVGLNYVDHAAESGFGVPEAPIVFTKFASSIAGPFDQLALSGDSVDWEVEMVAVIGIGGRAISAADALDHVAGFTVGQDYSDREVQFLGAPAQFSLGKSFPGFAPLGPVLVSPEDMPAPEKTVLECMVDGEVMQSAPLSDLIFPVPDLIARLSAVVTLTPGDLIFTGTPPGVGFGMSPRRYLRRGEVVRASITGIGAIEQVCA
ncbi:fumarylacetoacetate hydrolase family protein [Microbacterium sp. LRZ72]|uniref:fumarylacetoacetate hydrolase family protein n=1 Tax=Microbacterium sp. LRZ72 TaxID=2942481 RepID=UPI0029BD51B2|nr:fumarylacetoacetate hydrolase family protein [Microbacterium sp. LRZ72]MDX2376762.1 fumarylacetoacetate hydrolase family protein [Microbacterium sp. LRZ72]